MSAEEKDTPDTQSIIELVEWLRVDVGTLQSLVSHSKFGELGKSEVFTKMIELLDNVQSIAEG